MGKQWRSPSEAEKGSLDKEELGRRRSRSASRGRFAESWKRLSSRRGSTKRAGLQSYQPAVSVWLGGGGGWRGRGRPPAFRAPASLRSKQVAPALPCPAPRSQSPKEKAKDNKSSGGSCVSRSEGQPLLLGTRSKPAAGSRGAQPGRRAEGALSPSLPEGRGGSSQSTRVSLPDPGWGSRGVTTIPVALASMDSVPQSPLRSWLR